MEATKSTGHDFTFSLVDQKWEQIDPTPDIRALFLSFNERFFDGKLSACEVKWSPRMTLCAGLCSYEGRGGLCSIRLSQPLLKLRPRKDLVETLLDHSAHGPNFLAHMHRINSLTGTNVTVYHSFHDEVRHYKNHVWRCDGICRSKTPYFGYVKRAMNRAPSANDFWWRQHQNECGGSYTKISEPEDYAKRKGEKKKKSESLKLKETSGKTGSSMNTSETDSKNQRKLDEYFPGSGSLLGSSNCDIDLYSSAAGGNTPGSEPFRSAADEEQDILRRILAQTEANIIDVSSAGNERARHAEFVAKIEKYQALLGRAGSSMKRPAGSAHSTSTLLRDQLSITEALSRQPLSIDNVDNARRLADAIDRAARRGIKVEHKDELIVHMAN